MAQDPNYDRINEVAKKLNCPTCSGLDLADCSTLTCEQWRNQINDLMTQGYNDQEILDYFTTRYGDQVLQEPPKSGWRLFLWVLPFVALLVGGSWISYVIWKWTKQGSLTAPSSNVALAPGSYLRQVEKDLQSDEW